MADEEKLEQLKKEFANKFYAGLYPCINGACTAEEIWLWIENNFVPKNLQGYFKK